MPSLIYMYTRVFIFLNVIDNHNNNNNDDYNHIAHITITATTTIVTTVMILSPSPLLPPTENKKITWTPKPSYYNCTNAAILRSYTESK